MSYTALPGSAIETALESDSGVRPPSANSGSRVTFSGVAKSFGSTPVLRSLDLTIEPGEFLSILGPSGCGKSTALRLLAGLESPDHGEILIDGKDTTAVPANKRDMGMVFQSYSLFPHLNTSKNTAFGLTMRKVPRASIEARVAAVLDLVGLGEHTSRYPHQLSGGQQQRVALARALVTEPRVLLLDEPLSALDAKVRVQLRDEIRRIQLRLGITTVFVTHDQEEALAVSDRIAVMNGGRIEQHGTAEELYSRPASDFVADFVGRSSLISAVISAGTATVHGQPLPLHTPAADGPARVYLRPEQIFFASDGIPAVVTSSIFLGSIRRTAVRTADGEELLIQHPASERVAVDERVFLGLRSTPVSVERRGQAGDA
ncbi:ABC transporter ATP-binding protein [Okibacterium endophyticum]